MSLSAYTELYFRTFKYATLPLHTALIEYLCHDDAPPTELATVIEDIGQAYIRLAAIINDGLINYSALSSEPEADDTVESRIDNFIEELVQAAEIIPLKNGPSIDVSRSLTKHRFAIDALKLALHLSSRERT